MRILLLSDTTDGANIPQNYVSKLKSWGYRPIRAKLSITQGKRESEGDFISRIAGSVRSKYGDDIDFVQVFFSTQGWPISSGIKGKQYHAFMSGYQVAIVRNYGPGVAATAEHEFMHSVDNFCVAYTNFSLERHFGVASWDDDIVHRRDPATKLYLDKYDDVFPKAKPFLDQAIARRMELQKLAGLQALLASLLVELRKLKLAQKAPEEFVATQDAVTAPRETPVERSQAGESTSGEPKAPEPANKPKGVDYGPWPNLVKAIIAVESGGLDSAIGDHHLADKAYGCMQIRKPVCIDVNRAFGTALTPEGMLGNRQLSIDTFYKYMSLYATAKLIGRPPTDQDRARIWNGGPTGWRRITTLEYWVKVEKHL